MSFPITVHYNGNEFRVTDTYEYDGILWEVKNPPGSFVEWTPTFLVDVELPPAIDINGNVLLDVPKTWDGGDSGTYSQASRYFVGNIEMVSIGRGPVPIFVPNEIAIAAASTGYTYGAPVSSFSGGYFLTPFSGEQSVSTTYSNQEVFDYALSLGLITQAGIPVSWNAVLSILDESRAYGVSFVQLDSALHWPAGTAANFAAQATATVHANTPPPAIVSPGVPPASNVVQPLPPATNSNQTPAVVYPLPDQAPASAGLSPTALLAIAAAAISFLK